MAARRRSSKVEPEVEEVETDEIDYTVYRDKPPTDLQERMTDWVIEKVDPDLDDDEVDAFREGVRLGIAMRMHFQASPENQAVLAEQKAKRTEEAAKPKTSKAKAKAKAAAADEDELDEDEIDEAPAKPARKPARRAAAKSRRAAKAEPEPEPETDELDDEPEEEAPKPARRRSSSARKPAAAKPDSASARPTRRRVKTNEAAPF